MPELRKRLDEIGWQEQIEFELAERPATSGWVDLEQVESQLRALAASVDVVLLDALEQEPGYLVWALRLAPLVEDDEAERRARRHIDDPNFRVRYWAKKLLPNRI